MNYVIVPKETNLREILKKNSSFSPHAFKDVSITNKNFETLGNIIGNNFLKGKPISRAAFIKNSKKFLITNSALQEDFLLSKKRGSSFISLMPNSFNKVPVLMKESILLALNGNVGQSSYADIEDAENYTFSPWMINFKLEKYQNYIFGFLKSSFFRDQVEFLTPKGVILSNANKKILEAKIVFPSGPQKELLIEYIETLVQSIIHKEREIKIKNACIFDLINDEIFNNQTPTSFTYNYPKINEISILNRINGAFYSEYFKKREFEIKNYKKGITSIQNLGFKISRGQNLQVSCIGKSIYSDRKIDGFYTLVIPKNISTYGTVLKYEYLGSSKKLKTLKAGDIIFGAEGFEKGRSVVIFEDENNTITNIHGITLNHSEQNIILSVFVKCFLDYLRQIGLIDLYAVGGNGGSLAQEYWNVIPFPNFDQNKQKEIFDLYYKPKNKSESLKLSEYIHNDQSWNKEVGIFQIDESLKKTKQHLEYVIGQIVRNQSVDINFSNLI